MYNLYSPCVAFCDRLRYNRKSNVNEGLAMKQQGSIIGYVVVGTVLTLALVGGVLIVKNSHNSSARQVASTTATDAKKKESTQSNKSANDKLVDSLNSKSTEASKSKETQSQDKKNTTSTATNGATSGASSTTAQSQSQSTQSQSSSTPAATPSTSSSTPSQTQSTQQVSALPQTGPAESLAAVVAVSSLAGVALAYRKSRTPAL